MKTQRTINTMKHSLVWILTGLMLSGLLTIASMSLAAEDTWTAKSDMPTARFGLSTCVVDGKIYAIGGGRSGWEPFFSTVEEYDPGTDTWTAKADMPTARVFPSASVVNGKIYVIGGAAHREIGTSTVEEYDPATDIWTTKADMPTARYWLSTSAVNGKIYAIGGQRAPGSHLTIVQEYDPATDTWTPKADMPTRRQLLSTSVVNGKIYAIGGDASISGHGPALRIVEEYDPATDTWTAKADMPTARKGLFTSAVNGKIYAIGGIEGDTVLFSIMEEYDSATDTWARKADMPTARWLGSASVVGGKIYAIGGSVLCSSLGAPVPTVEVYDTGFVPELVTSVEAEGKLATTWGEIRYR
jgi:N-acetylneuraminic acid mutarotase